MSINQNKKIAAQGNRTTVSIDYSQLEKLWQECATDTASSALSQLIPLAKQKRVQAWLLSRNDYSDFQKLLFHEKPKVRKNTARLMGELKNPEDLPLLIQASVDETTLFVVPSITLAIGVYDSEQAYQALQSLQERFDRTPITVENKKHVEEVQHALHLAHNRHEALPACTFLGFPAKTKIDIYSMYKCQTILANETEEYHIPTKVVGEALECSSEYIHQAQNLRCAWNWLIPLTTKNYKITSLTDKNIDFSETIVDALNQFIQIATASFQAKQLHYRIELANFPHTYRATLSKQIASYIQKHSDVLHNSSTKYHIELRIDFHEAKQTCRAYMHSFIPPDERFSYRIGSLPASIHPVAAATLLRFAKPHLRQNARVLDPCCGSGTLLIERAKISSVQNLVGVDRNATALSIARENAKHAGESIDFIGGRLETFTPDLLFDEVIANLPFGTRVGTHQSIQDLHIALLKRLPQLLNPNGIAILYSTQIRLLRQLADKYGWIIVDQMRFDAGGLQPWALILHKKS